MMYFHNDEEDKTEASMTNKCQLLQANGIVFQVLIDA